MEQESIPTVVGFDDIQICGSYDSPGKTMMQEVGPSFSDMPAPLLVASGHSQSKYQQRTLDSEKPITATLTRNEVADQSPKHQQLGDTSLEGEDGNDAQSQETSSTPSPTMSLNRDEEPRHMGTSSERKTPNFSRYAHKPLALAHTSMSTLPIKNNSGIWAMKQSHSPLKDKINLFESLSQQGSVSQISFDRETLHAPEEDKKIQSSNSRRQPKSFYKYRGVKLRDTIRRLSSSWERSRARQPSSLGRTKTPDRSQGQSTAYHDTKSSGSDKSLLRESSYRTKRSFYPDLSTSLDSRRGVDVRSPRDGPFVSINDSTCGLYDAGHSSSSIERNYRYSDPVHSGVGGGPSPRTPRPHHYDGSRSHKERRSSQSWEPRVAEALCELRQPRPILGTDMRRLVSLCKDKMSGRR